eukprot:gene10138-2557_t
MKYTFSVVDPTEKKKPKKRNWVCFLPEEHQTKFQKFTIDESIKTQLQKSREKINKKLKNTGLNYDSLEKKYSNDTSFHIIMDLKGQSIWFNQSFMELTNRSRDDYLKSNYIDVLLKNNPDHFFTQFIVDLVQNQPKSSRIESSEILLSNLRKIKFRGQYERVDNDEGPIGYICHIQERYE